MVTLKTNLRGFTLLELIIAVAIVGILVSTVVATFGPAREQARDAQRQSDIRTVEAALALYKNKYGRYPEGCNGFTDSASPRWSGQPGSGVGYECNPASGQYIIGLAPEFIPELPVDPRLNSDEANSGYVYAVNEQGSVFKFMALHTVESEVVMEGNQFFRCGANYDSGTLSCMDQSNGTACRQSEDVEVCERVPSDNSNNTYLSNTDQHDSCTDVDQYGASYAVSAGFSSDSLGSTNVRIGQEFDTDIVRCG